MDNQLIDTFELKLYVVLKQKCSLMHVIKPHYGVSSIGIVASLYILVSLLLSLKTEH